VRWVGLNGAVARTKTGDAKTTGANEVSDEDRSEPIESSRLGLWRWSPSSVRSLITKRLGL